MVRFLEYLKRKVIILRTTRNSYSAALGIEDYRGTIALPIACYEEEYLPFCDFFHDQYLDTIEDSPVTVARFEISGFEVLAAHTRPGTTAAALATQFLIDYYCPDLVLNFGLAGAISERLPLGQTYVISYARPHDVNIPGSNRVPGQYPEAEPWLPLCPSITHQASINCNIPKAKLLTGNYFVSGDERQRLGHLYGEYAMAPQLVDMEGSAVAYACALNHVPCVLMKTVSDTFYQDLEDYDKNAQHAINYQLGVLKTFFETVDLSHIYYY